MTSFQEVRNCKYEKCGIEFTAKRRNQFYHAPKCKQADWHKNNFAKRATTPILSYQELNELSDDLLLDNFHWSQTSEKAYDLFRAELVRRLNLAE